MKNKIPEYIQTYEITIENFQEEDADKCQIIVDEIIEKIPNAYKVQEIIPNLEFLPDNLTKEKLVITIYFTIKRPPSNELKEIIDEILGKYITNYNEDNVEDKIPNSELFLGKEPKFDKFKKISDLRREKWREMFNNDNSIL